jgi:hypothetical protein
MLKRPTDSEPNVSIGVDALAFTIRLGRIAFYVLLVVAGALVLLAYLSAGAFFNGLAYLDAPIALFGGVVYFLLSGLRAEREGKLDFRHLPAKDVAWGFGIDVLGPSIAVGTTLYVGMACIAFFGLGYWPTTFDPRLAQDTIGAVGALLLFYALLLLGTLGTKLSTAPKPGAPSPQEKPPKKPG